MSEWQPIETAPLGESILLGKAGQRMVAVACIDDKYPALAWTNQGV